MYVLPLDVYFNFQLIIIVLNKPTKVDAAKKTEKESVKTQFVNFFRQKQKLTQQKLKKWLYILISLVILSDAMNLVLYILVMFVDAEFSITDQNYLPVIAANFGV